MNQNSGIEINTGETSIYLQKSGKGPALLLLHGFPETHLMWKDIGPLLTENFTVICPDLRGYGRSGCPASDKLHTPYSKRAMAKDMVKVIEQLGFKECFVAGHDRGGRVAYRLALDYPSLVKKLCVLDIIPTADAWNRADKQFALDFWPWSLLAQTEPFPELIIAAAPEAIINNVMTDWGTPENVFPAEIKEAYIHALSDPQHIHAICEEYRAAASIDIEHDNDDLKKNRRIQCPMMVLWAANGPLDNWYNNEGGPVAIWKNWAEQVSGFAIKGGHFFPEESPREIAQSFLSFFS
jgi:haloacetate dehalogenase